MLGVTPAHCSSMPPVYAMQHGETGCFEILQQAYMEYAGMLLCSPDAAQHTLFNFT